jgi:L-lysine 2,3-aminomutase
MLGIRDFYRYVRNYFLRKNGFDTYEIQEEKKEALEKLASKTASLFGVKKDSLWESSAFHMAFRISDLETLTKLNPEVDIEKIKRCIDNGRDISILPLNVLLGNPTIQKFIPNLPKLYSGEEEHSLDPYGIFRGQDQIRAITKDKKSIYLGSRKFDYAVLENITSVCPIGCAECYKGVLTRLGMAALADIDPRYAELKRELNLNEKRAIEQTRLLKDWLNKHPEIDTVIISGGEPLMYSPETIGKILDYLGEAKNLKAIRICTSAVYQGLFYKINDELLNKLSDFKRKNNGRNGRTKKQIYFNCHVTDENQLLTPEARIATERLQEAGISIHLQTPLQEGINFYRDDVERSAKKIKAICKAAYEIGVIPYKLIVNMHSPSYEELTVPIERVIQVITFLDGHFDTSDMERWQAYNILHEQGNIYLYPKPHFIAEKEIDKERRRVTYFIPKLNPDGSVNEVHTYEEPLLIGINDEDSLMQIKDEKIREKIQKVKEAYHRLRKHEIDTREFYRVSGIKFSENKPLIVE